MENKVALVTGANRGIGLEVARQLGKLGITVLCGARTEDKARSIAEKLTAEGMKVFPLTIDTSQEASISRAFQSLVSTWGQLDILVNNAGVLLDRHEPSSLKTPTRMIHETFLTNTVGPFLLCQKAIEWMLDHGGGRIVNVSSGMGQLSEMQSGYAAYRISKVALNAVTRMFAAETAGKNIQINSVCPGWVKTDMGGPDAHRTLEKGAETIVWCATSVECKASGGFFRDMKPISW